ncbi:3-dehydroquinate synthase [Brevibacillus dissolubilis]|uniref:3-dehydroquinate synthase n=1 Tax=Brevibacillus dissolubilis TaxID=1844116 RepID=UPI00111681E6|nr:3-dehydroquinate synthase [Brevibacillus dissolubilis]
MSTTTRTLVVDLEERTYPIHIGEGLLAQVPSFLQEKGVRTTSRLFIITDDKVGPLYLQQLTDSLEAAGYQTASETVVSGEKAKSFAVYEKVMGAAIRAGLDRKSVVLALGGGVVGDLAGFVAATYMRGIPFVQLPTTLLAHDSSVGGKVAINHELGKNLIGAFHQPLMVIYDTATLRTLPPREIAAGFAEVAKHGLISDEGFVDWLMQHSEALNQLDSALTAEAIHRGCAVKADIVSQDETEQGVRALLNLGHTFGHAFEALSDYSRLNHGEAISIGMVLAAELSERIELAPQGTRTRTEELLQAFRLPTAWPAHCDPHEVLEVMRRDKKGVGGKLVLVLPSRIGQAQIVKEIDESIIHQVMKEAAEVNS